MVFLPISKVHPHLKSIKVWYEEAFPVHERRNFDELVDLLPCPDMHVCALMNQEQLVGFIIYWQWNDVVFVEHFAIDPEQRGKQFGQQALAILLRIPYRYVILEVERPIDETSQRRVRFYERQGFTLNPFHYVQPPYQPGKPAVPMRLMSIPAITDEEEFINISDRIKERVYERFYT